MEPLNCYICNNTSMFYCKNIYKLSSKHSETPICDFIIKFLGKESARVTSNEDENIVCTDCLNKIDEYDLACITVERVERELRAALLHTESMYSAEPVFVDILDGNFDDEADNERPSIKLERRPMAKYIEEDNSHSIVICEICSSSFESMAEFTRHKKLQHAETRNIKLETVKSPTTKKNESSASDKITKAKSKPIAKKEKQFFDCSQCPAVFSTKSELKQHEKEHPTEMFTCEICGLATKTGAGLSRHRQLHSNGEPFECAICNKAFKKKNSLARHMRIHTGEKFYQCDKCGVEFIHKSSFRMHIMAHDDIREKKCPHCTLSFRSTSHLNRHLRIHTGAKPYSCPECGQKFAQRYNMMVHFRIHKGISRSIEKNHVCSICGIAFVRAQKLTEHYRKAHETIPHTIIGASLSTNNTGEPPQNVT